ncbi:hypothetical protein SAMN05421770_1128 [Granulicella rosea]|uniref:Uncharacterized protein n=1 Tax=Granulicella rosea TaxID=474952 RepID=A0A239MF77_9BACT|nr:hypothetical protein [Granulicella rosea]SNT41130.1 hypothetical protein SAMN05421770_1128 [Granulicella rosea]
MILRRCLSASILALALAVSGCAANPSSSTLNLPGDTLSLYLDGAIVPVVPGGAPSTVVCSSLRSTGSTAPITLSVTGVPAGMTATFTQPPANGNFGTLLLTAVNTAAPGTFPLTVTATDGTATSTAKLTATIIPTDAITLAAATPAITVRQDGTPGSTAVTVSRSVGYTNPITITATGMPTGLTPTYTQPAAGTTGTVTFTTASTPAAPGTYNITLTASDGAATATTTVAVTVGVVLTVANANDTTLGISGQLREFMSTGFQPSTYNNGFFKSFASTTDLAALNPLHIRLQPVFGAIPWVANSLPAAASDWSFTGLDQTVQPVLAVGDKSPIFQIAKAPLFLDDASGHFIDNPTNLALLTTYAQNLVRYYNTGGFNVGSTHFQSASSQHITWWAIFNEPNLNNLTATQYIQLYNTLVPAMLAVDPTLKFVGLELSDYVSSTGVGQAASFLPQMVLPANAGGINAPMNAIATHFYGTCVQSATDASLFTGAAKLVSEVKYIEAQLATRSDLAGTPVWVTENNVNSDYALTTGFSSCTPTIQYVLDPRGTSTFFTAYRPLLFSQLGKAGAQSLYHFLYEGSQAYGEVNSGSAAKTLAYWTDYWLAHTFPWDGVSAGALLYKTSTTEATPTVDILAVHNLDNSVSLMVTNYAAASTADDNGAGNTRTVFVNLTALGTFSSATEVDLNGATSPTAGPTAATITPGSTLSLTFNGYGSSMFLLKP